MGRFFRRLFESLPMIGGLTAAPRRSHAEALKELCFVWTLSLLPLLLTILFDAIYTATQRGQEPDLGLAFANNVKAGEIFIYVNALSAPIWFVLYKYNRDKAQF